MTATIARVQRFPIKGLSSEQLADVLLSPGKGTPGDRIFGFARHGSGFDTDNPAPLPKDKFVVLLTQAALAALHTTFDPEAQLLTISGPDEAVSFDLSGSDGRRAAEIWLSDYLTLPDPAPPRFVHAAPHRFTDVSVESPQLMNAISILNLDSVHAFGQRIGASIDPARFRANIEIEGLRPYWELENIGATLRCGDVEMRLIKRTRRCAATEVNPETADRDLRLPHLLRKEFGHMDMGVYAEITSGGVLRTGATVEIA